MDLTTARNLKNNFTDINTIRKLKNNLIVNKKVFFPIQITKSFGRNREINVYDAKGNRLGYIIFTKNINYDSISSPEDLQIALVNELDSSVIPSTYVFKYDYLIIYEENLKKYLRDYKNTSRLWGSFCHIEDIKPHIYTYALNQSSITANNNLYYPSLLHKEKAVQIITEPDPFTRFLKLYHLLELQFDVHTVIEINKLDKDYKEIGKILRDYKREDIERLTSIIKFNCKNLISLFQKLNRIKDYKKIAETLLYEYGKGSNPITSFVALEKIISEGGFTLQLMQKIDIYKFIAYCIYRVRSSIAHNKFGEFILTSKDEEFIINFAEPLIKEVIIQCFAKNT